MFDVRQAARAIDRRIYLLIGASLAMGIALERTGGASLIGHSLAGSRQISGHRTFIGILPDLRSLNKCSVKQCYRGSLYPDRRERRRQAELMSTFSC